MAKVVMVLKIEIGDKIYLDNERNGYTVRARSERFIIATKPFNLENTVYYFFIDVKEKWRAPDYLIFDIFDYKKLEDCEKALIQLESGELELSQRHGVPLTPLTVKRGKEKYDYAEIE